MLFVGAERVPEGTETEKARDAKVEVTGPLLVLLCVSMNLTICFLLFFRLSFYGQT